MLSAISQAKSTITTINEQMEEVNNLMNLLNTGTDSNTINEKFGELSLASIKLNEIDLSFDLLYEEVNTKLLPAVQNNIPGSSNFVFALKEMILIGKAYLKQEVALLTIQSEYFQRIMGDEVQKNKLVLIEDYISNVNNLESEFKVLFEMFNENSVITKKWIILSLLKHKQAFHYWALEESSIHPQYSNSFRELISYLSNIEQDYIRVMESFTSPPQDFNKRITISNPDTLEKFKKYGLLNISIPIDADIFNNIERVRVNNIRVFVEGPSIFDQEYSFSIANDGRYTDQLNSKVHNFVTVPLKRRFSYIKNDILDEDPTITMDGNIFDKYKYYYFEPTPFSNWEIYLENHLTINLHDVEKIRVEFYGNAIPSF